MSGRPRQAARGLRSLHRGDQPSAPPRAPAGGRILAGQGPFPIPTLVGLLKGRLVPPGSPPVCGPALCVETQRGNRAHQLVPREDWSPAPQVLAQGFPSCLDAHLGVSSPCYDHP